MYNNTDSSANGAVQLRSRTGGGVGGSQQSTSMLGSSLGSGVTASYAQPPSSSSYSQQSQFQQAPPMTSTFAQQSLQQQHHQTATMTQQQAAPYAAAYDAQPTATSGILSQFGGPVSRATPQQQQAQQGGFYPQQQAQFPSQPQSSSQFGSNYAQGSSSSTTYSSQQQPSGQLQQFQQFMPPQPQQPQAQQFGGYRQPALPTDDGVHSSEYSHESDYASMSRGPVQRMTSPPLGSTNTGVGYKSISPSFDSSDDRVRRKQNTTSLQHYLYFMYGLIALSVLTMLVAWAAMGAASKYVTFVLLICIASFFFTLRLTQWIFSRDDGNPAMRAISEAIREGSEGFLRVQYSAIGFIALIIAALVGFVYLFRNAPSDKISSTTLALVTSVAYLIGAFCSALAGYIGVWVSIRVNIRVAVAASKLSFKDSLLLSFRGGAVSACLSASLCITGVTMLYVFCYLFFCVWGQLPARHVPLLLVGYGFGGALVALFMQLGGGIYTKAADVGADMCGKIEANIPEDDPRNPAVIADLVGDNVGDCAGSMSDVFESIAAEVIGTMILGAALAHEANLADPEPFIFFPLVIHALDLVISSVGIMLTTPQSDKEDPLTTMKRAYGICMAIASVSFMIVCRLLLYTDVAPTAWWYYTCCGWIGIAMSFGLIRSTQYYTDSAYAPVKRIVAASQTGHGTNVIAGISVGLESTCFPTLIITTALITAYTLGRNSGLPGVSAGVFGTAVATMGMLCTAVFVLSMNNFGPIVDNAGGIVEMSSQPHEVRVITDRLDSVGNVTKAASKGYAVGGSALSCFVLFQAFLDEITMYTGFAFDTVNLSKVEVVCGGLAGMMMVFLFAGWSMQSVGTTAQKVVWEVRRQFKSRPGIMDGSEKPDHDACVAIVTRAALKEMVWPALLALLLPIAVGFGFKWFGGWTQRPQLGVEVVAAFMMCGTLAGLLMATFMDNAGGAWDNAKKLIESQGAKGSEAHKAAVTGDTVGDPFKDTAGPALHVIITTMSTTVLVLAPLFASAR